MKRFGALPLLLIAFALVACGPDWSVGPDDGGSGSGGGGGGGSSYSSRYFNKRFYYYFGEDCRYDAFGQSYDCSDYYSLSPMVNASLQITYDGYATLCVDDECSRYDPGEYHEGYDYGDRYYEFPGDDERMIVYADGSELVYIDTYIGEAYYYYHDYPFDYGY